MQASTYFQKVRGILLFHAPLILTRFWSASTLHRGHLALATLSPPVTDNQILERWAALMRFTWANISERRILVSNFNVTCNSFREFHTLDWFLHVWALPQNRRRLRRLHIQEYATLLSCTWWVSVHNLSPCSLVMLIPFQHGHCTYVIILFRPFTWLFINLTMCKRALFTKSATTLGLVEQAFWRVPLFTEWIGASSFEVILARPSRHSTTGTLSSGTSGFRRISVILLHERTRRRIRLCHFCTFIGIVTETAIVSFGTLPVGLPLPTISKNSLYTMFCPRILDHGVSFIISISGAKVLFS